jgi:hypothetical protein
MGGFDDSAEPCKYACVGNLKREQSIHESYQYRDIEPRKTNKESVIKDSYELQASDLDIRTLVQQGHD